MLIFSFHQHSENWRPQLWGGSVIWNFSVQLILTVACLSVQGGMGWGLLPMMPCHIIRDRNKRQSFCIKSIVPSFTQKVTHHIAFGSDTNIPSYNPAPAPFRYVGSLKWKETLELEMWIFHWFSFLNFSVGSIFPVAHLRFCFKIYAWLCLKHFCMVTFLHSEN